MTEKFKNKTILITGAGDGIGRAVARQCASHGATVILLGRTIAKLEKVYDEIEAAGQPQPAIFPLNLETSAEEHFIQLSDILTKEFPALDGLVHCATNQGSLTPLALYDTQLWYKVFQVNVHASFMLTRALLPNLNQSAAASVVFSVSQQAQQASAYWGAFGSSQAAIQGMMQIFADEHETDGKIRFNCLDPGPVATHFRRTAYPAELPDTQPSPDAVVGAYIYLLSAQSHENGASLRHDDPRLHPPVSQI